jgi:hypothetical protein
MKKSLLALLLCCLAVSVYAQDRSKMAVYVPLPTGGTAEQRAYFQENFKMELIGANYPAAETPEGSAYTLLLTIIDNPDFDSSQPADDYNPLYYLDIKLQRTEDNYEVVNFSFPFSDINAMSEWNLYLLYQALSNAYVPPFDSKDGPAAPAEPPPPEYWRNKWVYLNLGLGMDLGYFLRSGTMLTDQGFVMPTALVGLEFHFLDFLSLELDLIRVHMLNDGTDYVFAPGAAAELKLVLKPGYQLMVEPYAGAEYTASVLDFSLPLPWLWMQGGMQIGFRAGAGQRGAVTLDINAAFSLLGEIELPNAKSYSSLRFSIMVGCKVGFGNRPL